MQRDQKQVEAILGGVTDADALLRGLFAQVLALAAPANFMAGHLPDPPKGRTFVLSAGKAAAAMARAVEQEWPADVSLEGIAVTRYDHGISCDRIEVIEAAHPVPDASSWNVGIRALEEAKALTKDDLLLCLLSGGGSSLLVAPIEGVGLEEKQAVNKALLASGAPIGEMNTVRRHLSAIKGGRLAAAAHPARTVTLAISDVPGDDPTTIASGPTVPDPTTCADAAEILSRRGIALDPSVLSESPKPGDAELSRATCKLVATPATVLSALVETIDRETFDVIDLGAVIEGEARDVAATHAMIAMEAAATCLRPTLIVSGGETTVTVADHERPGAGGRNTEYALALAIALEGAPIHAIACDTDGIDGSENDAGAIVTPTTLARARAAGFDPQGHLDRHDSHTLFAAIDDLVTTGPTRTNVNDFRAILVQPERR